VVDSLPWVDNHGIQWRGVCNNSFIIHLHTISGEKNFFDEEGKEMQAQGERKDGDKYLKYFLCHCRWAVIFCTTPVSCAAPSLHTLLSGCFAGPNPMHVENQFSLNMHCCLFSYLVCRLHLKKEQGKVTTDNVLADNHQ
jgi:hypothetical protein